MTLFHHKRHQYNRCISGYATHLPDVGTVIVKQNPADSFVVWQRWEARAILSGLSAMGATRDEAVHRLCGVVNLHPEARRSA